MNAGNSSLAWYIPSGTTSRCLPFSQTLCQIEQVKNVNVDLTQLVAVVNLAADHETPLKLVCLFIPAGLGVNKVWVKTEKFLKLHPAGL